MLRELCGPYRGVEAVTILALTASASAPPTLSVAAVPPPHGLSVQRPHPPAVRLCSPAMLPRLRGCHGFCSHPHPAPPKQKHTPASCPSGVGVPRPALRGFCVRHLSHARSGSPFRYRSTLLRASASAPRAAAPTRGSGLFYLRTTAYIHFQGSIQARKRSYCTISHFTISGYRTVAPPAMTLVR